MRVLWRFITIYIWVDLLLGYAGFIPGMNSYAAGQQVPGQGQVVIMGVAGSSLPNFSVSPPVAPVATASTASGTLAAGQYSVRTTYTTASGETLPSVSTLVTLTAAGNITVTSPAAATGATSYNVYMAATVGSETKQGNAIAIGTAFTQSSALAAGAALPSYTLVPLVASTAGALTTGGATGSVDASGRIINALTAADADGLANGSGTVPITTGSAGIGSIIYPSIFNGASWDRNFYCPNTATFSVAATTTQVVALSGSTKVRVCSFVMSGNATAGSMALVQGTGTNCAAAQTSLSGTINVLGTTAAPVTFSGGATGALTSVAGNAVCVLATTTTASGAITYAQF